MEELTLAVVKGHATVYDPHLVLGIVAMDPSSKVIQEKNGLGFLRRVIGNYISLFDNTSKRILIIGRVSHDNGKYTLEDVAQFDQIEVH